MATRRKVNNLLALAILAQLSAGRPMHPYEIATVLKQQGKEGDMNIKWGSLYTVVQNLEKHGFIAGTAERAGRRPERTVYAITDSGRAELRDWLRELVAVPEAETNRYEAALSVLGVLPPDEATVLLEERLAALDDSIDAQRSALRTLTQHLPRVFLVEAEYAVAMREAEAAWTRSLLAELADETLSGLDGWRQFHQTGQMPAEFAELIEQGVPTDDSINP